MARGHGRVALLGTLVAAVVAVAVPAVLPITAAAETYTISTTTDILPAAQRSQLGTSVPLGRLAVPAAGTYYVDFTALLTPLGPDPRQYASVFLSCGSGPTTLDRIGHGTNLMRGETMRMRPRFYATFPRAGGCFAYALTLRIDGPQTVDPATRPVRVEARITAQGPVSDATRETVRFVDDSPEGAVYAGRSRLAPPADAIPAGIVDGTFPETTSRAIVSADAYLTACTSPNGSRDATTDGVQLCARSVVRRDALVRLRVILRQYAPDGRTSCHVVVVPATTRTVRITPARHHLPVAVTGVADLAGSASGCGRTYRAWLEVLVLEGPPVVVHWPGTSSGVRPV